MATEGTLGILEELQSLVSDKLQVVSYKWLSRNFSVSSNYAKRLLEELVSKHGNELQVIYTLSGWLKKNPEIYNIRLVSGGKLTEAKQEFTNSYSIQVYSVQTCIPKDPAVLWSTEFVQAEELFDQPSAMDNCLRDNRFCGISNSFVKRIVNGKSITLDLPKARIDSGISASSKANGCTPSFPTKIRGQIEQPKPKSSMPSPTVSSVYGDDDTANTKVHSEPSKPHLSKEKDSGPLANKKKVANEKAPQGGNGGSLANLWGRASAKSKPPNLPVDATHNISRASATSDTQICAQEALASISSDDDGRNISYKESSGVGRKRRVVINFSDDEDEENVVSLSSPEPPNSQSTLGSKKNAELEKVNLNFDGQTIDKVEVKQEKTVICNPESFSKGDNERSSKNETTANSVSDRSHDLGPEKLVESNKIEQSTNSISKSPKRKKVLKTRIDERGREVTEVVWEGDAADRSNVDSVATDNTCGNRPPLAAKSAPSSHVASNPVSKPGSTKTTKIGKDTKQANILSFFKKV